MYFFSYKISHKISEANFTKIENRKMGDEIHFIMQSSTVYACKIRAEFS